MHSSKRSISLSSSPGQEHCVLFLGKTVYSECLSPPKCKGNGEFNAGGNPAMD